MRRLVHLQTEHILSNAHKPIPNLSGLVSLGYLNNYLLLSMRRDNKLYLSTKNLHMKEFIILSHHLETYDFPPPLRPRTTKRTLEPQASSSNNPNNPNNPNQKSSNNNHNTSDSNPKKTSSPSSPGSNVFPPMNDIGEVMQAILDILVELIFIGLVTRITLRTLRTHPE